MILIKNARVMDPESGFDQVTDILLDGKRIRQIGKVDDVSGIEQVIDASGMIAAWIDRCTCTFPRSGIYI